METKIIKLTLTNFQGIRDMTIELGGRPADIFGANGSGKTTVYNALTWLLFDKPSTGAKNFNPKTKLPDGEDVHNLEHSVEAVMITYTGQMTLKKTFHEIWTKKRGAATEEFTGHAVDYYINDVPVKEKDFIGAILDNVGAPGRIEDLMQPLCFAEKRSWDDRRRVLLDIVGDISDADIIASKADLADIDEYLVIPNGDGKRYSVDEYKDIAAARKRKINEALKLLPAKISEAQHAIPEFNKSVEDIGKQILELGTERGLLENKLRDMQNSDTAAAHWDSQILEAKNNLIAAKSEFIQKNGAAREDHNQKISKLQTEIFELRNQHNRSAATLDKAEILSRVKVLREQKVAEYRAAESCIWDDELGVCPTCARELPQDMLEAAKADFNKNRSEQLESIRKEMEAKCSKTIIAKLEEELLTAQDKASEIKEKISQKESELQTLQDSFTAPAFEDTGEYQKLSGIIASLNDDKAEAGKCSDVRTGKIKADIDELSRQIDHLTAERGKAEQSEIQKKRVAELEAEQKTLAADYDHAERGVYLCELFIQTKVSLLDERINSHFKNVKFRMFERQINGGIRECCEVLVPGESGLVPFAFANNAARINAGLEIIEALSQHWGMKVPVIVDNAESVTELYPIGTQLIRLVVSADDKKLKVEVQ